MRLLKKKKTFFSPYFLLINYNISNLKRNDLKWFTIKTADLDRLYLETHTSVKRHQCILIYSVQFTFLLLPFGRQDICGKSMKANDIFLFICTRIQQSKRQPVLFEFVQIDHLSTSWICLKKIYPHHCMYSSIFLKFKCVYVRVCVFLLAHWLKQSIGISPHIAQNCLIIINEFKYICMNYNTFTHKLRWVNKRK